MSNMEKRKSKKSKKPKKSTRKKKKNESEGEVLERVMDSIEMAGASLDFFEGDSDKVEMEEPETLGETHEANSDSEELNELDAALADQETLEATSIEEIETTASGEEEELEAQLADSGDEIDENGAQDSEISDEMEASSSEQTTELDEDAETMDMLEEENSQEFIEQKQAFSIIESVLFSSERPLGIGTFKQVFKGTNYKTKEIKKALEELQSEYVDAARGVTLEEINGGWQLRTKVDNMDFLRRLAKARPFKLSGPALEVLAIIAYKQPLVKSEVDEIRGVESGHLVRALMEKGIVCFQGKSELPGKPMQYGTTRKFLEIFGLRNLRELPSLDEIDQLLPDGIGIEEEDEKLADVTASMSEDYQGNYSEGEEELIKIEDTLGEIDTSSEFFEEEKRRQKEKRDRDRARDIREALVVGEEVDTKDQRWLERYDAKQAELAAAAEQEANSSEESSKPSESTESIELQDAGELRDQEEVLAESEEVESLIASPESLSQEFSNLMKTDLVDPEVIATDHAMEEEDESLETLASENESLEVADDSVDSLEKPSEGIEEEILGAETFDPFEEEKSED